MATLQHGTLLGTFKTTTGSFPVYAYKFSETGTLHVAQEIVKDSVYVIRSRNFVMAARGFFTQASGFADTDATQLPASKEADADGFEAPTGFVAPNGWAVLPEQITGNPLLVKSGWSGTVPGIISVAGPGTTTTDTGTIGTRSASVIDSAINYVKENPLLTAGIVLVVMYLFHQMNQSGKKKKSKFLGII